MQRWARRLGCMVTRCSWACYLVPGVFGEGRHPQGGVGALVATDDCATTVDNGAGGVCEGHLASGVAHGDDGE